jgi:hypothetical protein
MLVTCVECGNATSDTALQCPKCASPRAAFLGRPFPCHECGSQISSAYSACPSCGAHPVRRSLAADEVKEPDSDRVSQLNGPPNNQRMTDGPSDHEGPVASTHSHDEEACEPAYTKLELTPLQAFGWPLRLWLLVFAVVMFAEALLLGVILWVLTPAYQGGPGPEIATAWASLLGDVGFLLNLARIICIALCAYFYSRFLFRALKNLRPVVRGTSSYNPTWGVLMQFIPVVNLLGVFAMSAVWNGSHSVAKRPAAANGLLGTWWTFWVGAGLLGVAGNTLLGLPGQLTRGGILVISASIAAMIAALLLRKIIWKITDAHDSAPILSGRNVSTHQTA